MRTEKNRRFVIDTLFVLALFALFALSSVLLIALGASVYRAGVTQMDRNYEMRTAYAYVAEKVRHADEYGGVETGRIDGQDALILRQNINDISYTTYLYVYEGQLTELFSRSDLDAPASAGNPIMEIGGMSFAQDTPDLLQVTLTGTDGDDYTMSLHIRTLKDEGGAP